jgi:uncharacterized protein with beta-barrel porin domain
VLFLSSGATINNNSGGTITGGNGGAAGEFGTAGAGGVGISGTGLIINNNSGSTITGGNGGGGLFTTAGAGGVGISGTGLIINNNGGTITGGNGGSGLFATAGAGGTGFVGSGLTVINGGAISGGLGGDGVTHANAITFTGGTNALELQPGSSIAGNVVAFSTSDTFRLGGTGNASFDATLIGTQYLGFGIFQKTGSSTWTLTGSNSAALPWSINAGVLAVNGLFANSTMTVNNGGTLAGTGTVGNTQINSGGIFAPGSGAPGTSMIISGNLAFQSGALYLVQFGATASMANVSGTATLAGTVQASFAGGSVGKSYDILHATSGLGGTTFSGVTISPNFGATLSFTPTDVLLNLTAALGTGGGLNQNQQNVANAINGFFNNGGTLPPNFGKIFGLTDGALANALTQIDGEAATGAERAVFQLANEFMTLMLDPFVNGRGNSGGADGPALGFAPDQQTSLPPDIALAYGSILTKAPPAPTFGQRWTAWGSAYGGGNIASGNAVVGSNNVTASTFGFAGGMDYHFSPNGVVGFALAGAGTNWGLANALGTGRSDALQVGAYGISWFGPAYLAAALAVSNHWFTTDRSALDDELTAKFAGQSYGARLEGGYRYAMFPAFGVTPYGAVQFQDFHTPSYSESDLTGGSFGLTYNAMNATDVRTELGARFQDFTVLYNKPLTLFGRLAWAHDFVSNPALNAVFQALPGASFTVFGAPIPHDSALTTLGAQLFLTPYWSLLAKFEGEFANGSQTYAGTGTLRYVW